MVKKAVIQVRDTMIRTLQENGIDYICTRILLVRRTQLNQRCGEELDEGKEYFGISWSVGEIE